MASEVVWTFWRHEYGPRSGLDILETLAWLKNWSGHFGDMSMAPEVVWTFWRHEHGPRNGLDILEKTQSSISGLNFSEIMIIHCVCLQQKFRLLSLLTFGLITVGLSYLDPPANETVVK